MAALGRKFGQRQYYKKYLHTMRLFLRVFPKESEPKAGARLVYPLYVLRPMAKR